MNVRHGLMVLSILCGLLLQGADVGKNIFPQGDFEQTGNSTVCRSGKKSRHHVMTKPLYYRASDYLTLEVEPFAVYEATGYVKGRVTDGYARALVFYDWDSFGWGFLKQVALPREMRDWRRVSTRFCVPVPKLSFLPLVLSNAHDGELWLDDVTIVKVQNASDHLRELEGREKLKDHEVQLLARHYLDLGQIDRALALRAKTSAFVKADITCQVALRSKDLKAVRFHTVDLMRQGCLRWADGKKRVPELLSRFPFHERLAMCLEAIRSNPIDQVINCLQYVTAGSHDDLSRLEYKAQLESLPGILSQVRGLIANRKGVKGAGLAKLESWLAGERARLEAELKSMGSRVIQVSGHGLTREGAVIVLPKDPTPSERTAARALAMNLEQMSKALLDIVSEADLKTDGRYPILIGRSANLSKLGFQVDYGHLGKDGIQIESNGRALLLAGGQRGVLYAVYSFLEDELGCRWFTPDCSVLPKSGTISLGNFKRVYVPALKMRATDYSAYSRQLPFPVQLKYNSLCMPKSVPWGDNIRYKGFVHTMNALIPPAQYMDSHPEYYALWNGERVRDRKYNQPCLTNPEVLKIATANALRWCEQDPGAQIISISQNDNQRYCQCPACTALAEKEGSQMGPLLHFVNAIAREIAKKYPDKVVDTLAYQYTRKPPLHVRPEPNVAIRLCTIECCFVHPLESCPFNKKFVDDIIGWSKICRRLHIWDYVINYAHCIQPFPNLRVLKPNIRFFIEHGVTGVYEEANYFSRGAEMAELRTYLMGKLLWNPDTDVELATREFTDAYYGPAGRLIRQYLNLIHNHVCQKQDQHVRIYAATNFYLNDAEMLAQAFQIFEQAEKIVADNPVLLRRVRNAKLPILYTKLSLARGNLYLQNGRLARRGMECVGLLKEFVSICQTERVTHVGEGKGRLLKPWIERQRSLAQDSQVLTLESKELRMDILPDFGGRIWRLQSKKDGRQLLRVVGDNQRGFSPDQGGIEWYSSDAHRGPGYAEPFKVVRQGPDFVELSSDLLSNGRVMTRRIEFLKGRVGFRVLSEVRQVKGKDKIVFRCHPEFAVSNTQDAVLRYKSVDGQTVERSLAHATNPKGEYDLWLKNAKMPAGEWSVLDKKTGIQIINRFKTAETGISFCNWNGAQSRVNLELWSKEVDSAGNKAARSESEYEFILP